LAKFHNILLKVNNPAHRAGLIDCIGR